MVASALAASSLEPSQPIITTSVVWMMMLPTLVSTIGPLSAVSLAASSSHGERGTVRETDVAMAEQFR